jgi:hypothetical protein
MQARACVLTLFFRIGGSMLNIAFRPTLPTLSAVAAQRDDVDVYEHRAASVVFYYACQPAIPPGVTRKA